MSISQSVTPPPRVRRGVIGILSRGRDYLLIQRALCVPKGGTWCFPGGHLEAGENARAAVQRELLEELGIVIRPTLRIGAVHVPDSRHVLAVWRVEHVSGEFRICEKEIADYAWRSADEIRTLDKGLPSNEYVLRLLGH